MLRAALLLAVTAAAALAATASPSTSMGTPAPQRTVPCRETIADTQFPHRDGGYRTVLGAVSVPPLYLSQIEPNPDPKWPWWRKAGLVVRANGRPVTITVPEAWRGKVAVEWGNAGTGGPFTALRIHGCQGGGGHAYAGGFVASEKACVPLTFHVGTRSATVRFGLGKRCG